MNFESDVRFDRQMEFKNEQQYITRGSKCLRRSSKFQNPSCLISKLSLRMLLNRFIC
jgi:hypothetical protein